MATPIVDLEAVLKVLGDRTRLRILGLLLHGETCVCDIHETLKAPQPKVSRHLAVLRHAGLVDSRREGLWVHYRLAHLADPRLALVADTVRHVLAQLDAVQRDAARLQQRGSRCTPAPLTFVRAAAPGPSARRRAVPGT